ncbi:AraC family ligand binding domain-containing protein [Paenibacillus sp. CC-CFT747]|nr:AraC family ligand binding domain-containing protein [Paenibacillus sp. CC-CFT747]
MEEAMLRYQEMSDSLCVEYIKRHGRYSMAANHFHPTYEVYYLLKGERIYFIRDSSYAVQPGDLVFLPRYALHKTIHSGIPSHERMVIYFDERFLYEAGGRTRSFC